MYLTKKKQRVLKSFTLEDLKNPVTKRSIIQALHNRQVAENHEDWIEDKILFQNLDHEAMAGV